METQTEMSPLERLRRVNWWLWLIGPAALTFLTVGYTYGWEAIQDPLELAGPYLVGIALALYALRFVITRNPLYMIVTMLAAALLCREIHFPLTHHVVTVLAPVAVVWALIWHKRLREPVRDWRHTSWLMAAFWAYVFSQFITKRVFSEGRIAIIPRENDIHTQLEESLETVAHCVFIMAALVGNWRRYGKGAARIAEAPEAPDAADETAS